MAETFEEWYRKADAFAHIDEAAATAWHARDTEIAALERKLERVRGLPEKWVGSPRCTDGIKEEGEFRTSEEICADELQSALEDQWD